MGIESFLMWAGAFFGAGTLFALSLCGASEPELLGTGRTDEVGSART